MGLCDALEFPAGRMRGGRRWSRDVLLNMIAEITGESSRRCKRPTTSVGGSHLDSLGRVQLQSALEQQLGVELEDDAIVGVETLGDLRALLERKEGIGLAFRRLDIVGEVGPAPVSPADVPASVPHSRWRSQKSGMRLRLSFPRWPWGWPIRAVRVAFSNSLCVP